jgi:hypothetical protein
MLVRRFDRRECGEWRANSYRGEQMMGMFSAVFQKFGPSGIAFYFGDAFRKLSFQLIVALTPRAAAAQVALTFVASLAQWAFVGLWLPYNHLGHNFSELAVLGMQTLTLALPLLGHAGQLSWREVGDTMILVQLVTTAFNVGRLAVGTPARLLAIVARLSGVAKIFAVAAKVVAEHERAIGREVMFLASVLAVVFSLSV